MVNILHYFFNVVNALYCTMVRLLVPQLLFTHNYIRQGFYSPVAIRKLAVTKFYPVLMKLRKKSQIKLLTASNAQAKVL